MKICFPCAAKQPLLGCLLFLSLCSCATYTSQSQPMRTAVYNYDFLKALETLDTSSLAKSKNDQVLYRMERGYILYLNQRYKEAPQEWDLALRRVEELYTISLTRSAATFLVNEGSGDYEGEVHERVLLPVFSALSYFSANLPNEAIVEARRTARILDELNQENDNKNRYASDSFAHYLAGLTYETKREWDNALIEYRHALDAVEQNSQWATRLAVAPIVQAVGRLAEYRNRPNIVADLKRKYPSISWQKQADILKNGEVIVVYEAGKVPQKDAEDILFPVGRQIVRLSWPKFVDQSYRSHSAQVSVSGKFASSTVVLEDVGANARQALQDRRGKDLAKMAARAIAKGAAVQTARKAFGDAGGLIANVAAIATEVADTRSWSTLPDTIQLARITVPPDKPLIVDVTPQSGKPLQAEVRLEPGDKRVLRLRTFE